METAPTTPNVPVSAARPRKITAARVITIVVLIIVLAAAATYAHLWRSGSLAFQGARFLGGSFEERALYEFGLFSVKQVSLPVAGRVIDYARAGEAEAVIIDSEGGSQDVYLLASGEPKLLASGPTVRSALSVSADGTRVAFAERVSGESADTSSFYDPATWTVKVAHTETGETLTFGNGFGTNLFVRDGQPHLLYGTTAGAHIANLGTGEQQSLLFGVAASALSFPVMVSPDGALIAIPSPSQAYSIYSLERADGIFALGSMDSLHVEGRPVALEGDTVLSVSRSSVESFFYAADLGSLDAPSAWKRIPYRLVTKLIP